MIFIPHGLNSHHRRQTLGSELPPSPRLQPTGRFSGFIELRVTSHKSRKFTNRGVSSTLRQGYGSQVRLSHIWATGRKDLTPRGFPSLGVTPPDPERPTLHTRHAASLSAKLFGCQGGMGDYHVKTIVSFPGPYSLSVHGHALSRVLHSVYRVLE